MHLLLGLLWLFASQQYGDTWHISAHSFLLRIRLPSPWPVASTIGYRHYTIDISSYYLLFNFIVITGPNVNLDTNCSEAAN